MATESNGLWTGELVKLLELGGDVHMSIVCETAVGGASPPIEVVDQDAVAAVFKLLDEAQVPVTDELRAHCEGVSDKVKERDASAEAEAFLRNLSPEARRVVLAKFTQEQRKPAGGGAVRPGSAKGNSANPKAGLAVGGFSPVGRGGGTGGHKTTSTPVPVPSRFKGTDQLDVLTHAGSLAARNNKRKAQTTHDGDDDDPNTGEEDDDEEDEDDDRKPRGGGGGGVQKPSKKTKKATGRKGFVRLTAQDFHIGEDEVAIHNRKYKLKDVQEDMEECESWMDLCRKVSANYVPEGTSVPSMKLTARRMAEKLSFEHLLP
jgi:hypothetical protein